MCREPFLAGVILTGFAIALGAVVFAVMLPAHRFNRAMADGFRAEQARDWDGALQAYACAELLRPQDPAAARAFHRAQRQRDNAFYRQAVLRATDAERAGDWHTAATAYEEALRWKPEDVWAATGRDTARYHLAMQQGRSAMESGNWWAAAQAFNRALGCRPHDPDALAALARLPKPKLPTSVAVAVPGDNPSLPANSVVVAVPGDTLRLCARGRALLQSQQPATVAVAVPGDTASVTLATSVHSAPIPTGKLPEIQVRLQWTRAALPRADTAHAHPTPQSVASYLLEKIGDSAIAVGAIPATDLNAWSLVADYESAAADTASLYRLVGQHLLIAEHLLQDNDLAQRRRGLAFALQATRAAARRIKDMPLAVAIADSFLLPHFETAGDTNPSAWLSSRSVLEEIVATYILAKDEARQTAGYQLMLERATDPNTADFVRFRLAQLSRKAGRDEEALKFLREITPDKGGMAGMRRLIPGIERKLQLQNPRQGVNP